MEELRFELGSLIVHDAGLDADERVWSQKRINGMAFQMADNGIQLGLVETEQH